MFRKLLLLICIAFVVVCYGYPCLILPLGSYTYNYEDLEGNKQEMSLQFNFNGTLIVDGSDNVSYYKLKGDKVIISNDKNFEEEAFELKIKNFYELEGDLVVTDLSLKNNIAMYSTIGVGALAVVLVLITPNKGRE